MHRNLDRRVEAMVQVTDLASRTALHRVLEAQMGETTTAFELSGDGTWQRRGDAGVNAQEALLRRIVDKSE